MVSKDPCAPGQKRFQCPACGQRLIATDQRPRCPECGETMQGGAVAGR